MLKVSKVLNPDVPFWDPSSLQCLMKNDDLSILKLSSAHIFALDYESREEMRGVQGLHPAAKTNTSAIFSFFISCDTEIRGHHDTIEPPHFRLISHFQPKTHLHSLRAVMQTGSLQKNTLFNEFLNPHSNPAKTMRPGPNSLGHGISSLNYFNKYDMASY